MQSGKKAVTTDEHAMARLHDELISRAFAYSTSTCNWATGLIMSAYEHGEKDMLEFFEMRMTASHLPDLLRVVLLHAQNLGINPASITNENVAAYKAVTANQYGDFGLVVCAVPVSVSNDLISLILKSDKASRVALSFINERGLDPVALLEHLNMLEESKPVLMVGTL